MAKFLRQGFPATVMQPAACRTKNQGLNFLPLKGYWCMAIQAGHPGLHKLLCREINWKERKTERKRGAGEAAGSGPGNRALLSAGRSRAKRPDVSRPAGQFYPVSISVPTH
jgi:hypothetical protein